MAEEDGESMRIRAITVRAAEPRDAKNYADWLKAAEDINLVDRSVYSYPTTNTIVVEKDGEPVLMNSFQAVLVMEALAPKPGISPMDEARALKELFEGVKRIAAGTGVKEIMFACKDPRVIKFVEKHGGEVLSVPVLRFKL